MAVKLLECIRSACHCQCRCAKKDQSNSYVYAQESAANKGTVRSFLNNTGESEYVGEVVSSLEEMMVICMTTAMGWCEKNLLSCLPSWN